MQRAVGNVLNAISGKAGQDALLLKCSENRPAGFQADFSQFGLDFVLVFNEVS
jgi:hypothetical protein